MIKLFVAYTILQLVVCDRLQAQCSTAIETLNSITSIQSNNTLSFKSKVDQLQKLRELYLICYKVKDSVYARIVHRLGDIYGKTNDFANAIRYTREAITINAANNQKSEKSFLAHSYLNMGLFYKWSYLPQESLLYFDSCIFVSKQYPEKYFILFKAFEEKAYAFFEMGDYQKCIDAADNGILFSRSVKDSLQEASLLSRKAQAEVGMKNIADAEQDIKKSILFFKQNTLDTDQLAINYSIYANLLNDKGENIHAIQYHLKSFDLNLAKKNWVECSKNMLNLGYLYDTSLHQKEKAIACYKRGIELMSKADDNYQLAGLYINMGVFFWHQQDYIKALQFYQKALNVLPIHFSDTAIKSNPSVNMLSLVANDYYVTTLLSNKGEALLAQYTIEKKQELLKVALNTFLLADKSVDIMRWKQYGEQSKLFWRQKTKSMYEHAIEVCYLLKDVDKALYFFEKSRAVLLNDKLSELGAKRFISAADQLKEQAFSIKISSLNQQLSSLNDSSVYFNSIKQKFFNAQEELEKFIKSLEKKYPAYYKYKYDNAVYPLTTVREKLLADNQSMVEYFTGESAIYILAISTSGNSLLKVFLNDYASTSKELMQLCSDKTLLNQNYSRYCSLSYRLYEKLFKPLNIPEGRVIISPDENFIPFEALISDSNDRTSFLLKKFAFSYAYSAGLLMKNTYSTSATGNSFLGVAPVNYQPYLNQPSLDGADESLNNIRPYFQSAKFLVKQKATKKQFLKNLYQYNIVQIYSHANVDSSGMQPVLYLYDSSINISDIQSQENVKTGMIVLSACKTGIGRNAKGEGIFSLARAFTAAGIPSMMTTLWQIDNKVTYQLTENFYKNLSLGMPKDVALQKAKLEFLKNNDKTYELPYYWAANILLGKTDMIQKTTSNTQITFAVIIVSILLIISVIFILIKKLKKA